MTLAKATVSGTVYREPQSRFTKNDVEVWDLLLNIDEKEETLLRVISKRKALSDMLKTVNKGEKLLVDGRLQIATTKTTDGAERKFFEIDAFDIERLAASSPTAAVTATTSNSQTEELVSFKEADFGEEELIDDEEIPF